MQDSGGVVDSISIVVLKVKERADLTTSNDSEGVEEQNFKRGTGDLVIYEKPV